MNISHLISQFQKLIVEENYYNKKFENKINLNKLIEDSINDNKKILIMIKYIRCIIQCLINQNIIQI